MSAKGPIGKLLGLFFCVVLIRFILWSIMATSQLVTGQRALYDVAYSGQAILEGPIFIRANLERDNLNLGGLTTSREVNH
jgi:hypothetical protein